VQELKTARKYLQTASKYFQRQATTIATGCITYLQQGARTFNRGQELTMASEDLKQ